VSNDFIDPYFCRDEPYTGKTAADHRLRAEGHRYLRGLPGRGDLTDVHAATDGLLRPLTAELVRALVRCGDREVSVTQGLL
jgi:hypothetical protein